MKQEAEWSWFNHLALPHATMRLKQGVGRLIRTKKDVGIVAILDSRMTGKGYGRRILECLPGMRIVRTLNGLYTLRDVFGPRDDYGSRDDYGRGPEVREKPAAYGRYSEGAEASSDSEKLSVIPIETL